MVEEVITTIAFDLGGTLLVDKGPTSGLARYFEPVFNDDKYYSEAIEHFGVAKPLIDKMVDEVIEECFEVRDWHVFTAFPGFSLAIASNFTSRMRQYLEQQDIVRYFQTVVISGEIGVNKPNPEFYQILAKRCDEEPEYIMFVDNLQVNVDAATQLGFLTMKYNEGEDIVRVVKNKIQELI